jgi:hypothetical protein
MLPTSHMHLWIQTERWQVARMRGDFRSMCHCGSFCFINR